jgi:methylenetetrahydrofolate dehydrogenase (NADP+)/methenyltetrahydrofolate cyclohydrolase
MSAQLIDGVALAAQKRQQITQDVSALAAKGIRPCLAVILVGDDPASAVYVRNKVKACQACGLESLLETYDASLSEAALLSRIQALNERSDVHGILVQLPLPAHIRTQAVIEAISPHKDVDGFHVASAGALMLGQPGFWPCTPHGCLEMINSIDYDLRGKHAVVVGRSAIVGKPMALMLLDRHATATICHSATLDLGFHTRQADVLVAAVGRPGLIRADMVKPGAVVIDVGINRNAQGQLCGDVDFEGVQAVAAYLSPVPGGVGPMTITMLLANTVRAAQQGVHSA